MTIENLPPSRSTVATISEHRRHYLGPPSPPFQTTVAIVFLLSPSSTQIRFDFVSPDVIDRRLTVRY
ncbi:hypothetical protein OSB04_020628 [Centaurea solstitialis]|uniref:Uncharacterized protein n=1 Tax=Centaurea solstitialis TaxID=347529 RepID=A0AA38SSL5_9ASTR|nr:hypothetical protein OSB04_020628 [Centaurea solstitialis]